ncbi:MAG: SapC family protein [Azospirillaceae bacterium]
MPVDYSRHKGKSFKAPATFGYAAKTNSVPVNVIEFPVAALDYVLAFAPGSEPIPVAVLGLRTSENLFVDRDGRWDPHSYLPAYIRRYPFIFMSRPDQQLTLCIDETPETVVAGNERPLVVDGKASPQAEQALKFCQDYHSAGQQTHAFARKLVELDLLVDRAAAMDMGPDQRKISLGGLKVVSEARLGALDPATFAGLRERGFLTAIYAHLLSLNNLNKLGRRLNERLAAEKANG